MNQFTIKPIGGVVFWSVSGNVQHSTLVNALEPLGLARIVPNPPTPESALRSAMLAYCESILGATAPVESTFAVYPRKNPKENGFEAWMVNSKTDNNEVSYQFAASYDQETKGLKTEHGATWVDRTHLAELLSKELGAIDASAIGRMLADYCRELSAVTLRPTGGFYWLPESALAQWGEVTRIIAGASGASIYLIRHELDGSAITAVRDSLIREVTEASRLLIEQVKDGELGKRALNTRVGQALALRNKVADYERILGETMTTLRSGIDLAETTASSALAVLEDDEIGDTLFAGKGA